VAGRTRALGRRSLSTKPALRFVGQGHGHRRCSHGSRSPHGVLDGLMFLVRLSIAVRGLSPHPHADS
jgi:hypothetical protein